MARNRETEEPVYHVVGVRVDGTTAVISGLSKDEAKRIRDALAEANVFPAVQVKRGDLRQARA